MPLKEEVNEEVIFSHPKDNFPKCIYTKEENGILIKVFKFSGKIKDYFEFSFDEIEHKLSIDNPKEKTFLYDITLKRKDPQNNGIYSKLEQNKLGDPDKMNFFTEALTAQKETDKLETLYSDSIKLFSKTPKFHFLINIFVHVYNTKLCSSLLEEFSKKIEEKKMKDVFDDKNLEQYKFNFDQICDNIEDTISSSSLSKIDFYGLVLCYLNNYGNNKYQKKWVKMLNFIKELPEKKKKK